MLDEHRDGRAYAKAFIAQVKEFKDNTLDTVRLDLRMRRVNRRVFRMGNVSKVLFSVGISSFLVERSKVQLNNQDYAELAGLRLEQFLKLVKKNLSVKKLNHGYETDRRRFNPDGNFIDGIKPGSHARLLSYVFADYDSREKLKKNDFAEDFIDELANEVASEDFSPISEKDKTFIPLKGMADELLNIPLAEMLGPWSELLDDTKRRTVRLMDKKRLLGADDIFISNCGNVCEILTRWRNETGDDVNRLSEYGGKYGSYLLHVFMSECDDPEEFSEAWNALIRMAIALYYTSPQLPGAFGRYTDFAPKDAPLDQHSGHILRDAMKEDRVEP